MPKKAPTAPVALKEDSTTHKDIMKLTARIEELVEKVEEVHKQNKKIKRRMTLAIIGGYIRLALIVIPLIIAAVYLTPMLREMWDMYLQVFGVGGVESSGDIMEALSQVSGDDIQNILKQIQQ